MNIVKSRSVEGQSTPIALSRSSIKTNRQSSVSHFNPSEDRLCNYTYNHDKAEHATSIDISSSNYSDELRHQNVQLVIAGSHQETTKQNKEELDLDTLIEEYQSTLKRKNCNNDDCQRFKLISYKISEALFGRINILKQEFRVQSTTNQLEASKMDNQRLASLVDERDRRIQDLERLVEDQKRLRVQDANQVEEKAARIKEWVANKLKELENQNRQLREQNKRQKEVVEILNSKLTSFSPLSTPIKVRTPDGQSLTSQISPVQTLDVNKSLKLRRPQLRETFQNLSAATESEFSRSQTNFQLKMSHEQSETTECNIQAPSPIYDSVSAERLPRHLTDESGRVQNDQINMSDNVRRDNPPPPPLHQIDLWERELYNLVDQMSLDCKHDDPDENQNNLDSIDSICDRNTTPFRKSCSGQKNDLTALLKPSYKTIDGDQVIDSSLESELTSGISANGNSIDGHKQCSDISHTVASASKDSANSCNKSEKSIVTNLFDSPIRSRAGKECILRTQSVRRNPTPEKLYDFIAADLVKRGYLIKPGALKSHQRWIVLKNFQLLIYKSDSDETDKAMPAVDIKLRPNFNISAVNQASEAHYPFKLQYNDKSIQLIADTSQLRDEWIRIITNAIIISDLEPEKLTKQNSALESLISYTRQGHTRRSYAILVNHLVFFLKSPTDPTPISYIAIKGSRIREVTDTNDYDVEEQELMKNRNHLQDCCIAIYPRFAMSPDPIYLTFGDQKETDRWLYHLTCISGINQAHGTKFEQSLSKFMMNNSNRNTSIVNGAISICDWRSNHALVYSESPIDEPLTSLPNETLRNEALELFKSILLFTQVPIELIAIDYHVSLLQNCMSRFLRYPELRNELFAQLLKQCIYVEHHCGGSKSSSCSSGCSSINQRSSFSSLSPTNNECQVVSDLRSLETITNRRKRLDTSSTLSQLNSLRDKVDGHLDENNPPTRSELLQTIQVLSIAVSLNLPRGRLRCWLVNCLERFSDPTTSLGKYALYTLQAIERTVQNGPRDNVPSRMEVMSILSRNPHDHSSPHSLPVSFIDSSYLVIEADGSTTVEEFLTSMGKIVNIRESSVSDFYLFSDDPAGSHDIHILEPHRKIMDIVGWWEQIHRRHNSGKYQTTKAIKLTCRKRLLLRTEQGETQQERLLIVHQVNHEVVNRIIPLTDQLTIELGAVMAQLNYGDYRETDNPIVRENLLGTVAEKFLPDKSSHANYNNYLVDVLNRWKSLAGKSAQECVRVYLNCFRRLKLSSD